MKDAAEARTTGLIPPGFRAAVSRARAAPRWLPLAIAAVVALVVGGAAALTWLNCAIDEGASVVAGPGPGAGGSALPADHLLTTSQVESVVDGLEEYEYPGGDHAVLGPTELGIGWTDRAASGVTRQWVRAYEWSVGDPVPEHIVHVNSTILEFESHADAEAAVEKLRAELPLGTPIGGTPPGYAAYGPADQQHRSEVRSCSARKCRDATSSACSWAPSARSTGPSSSWHSWA